LITVSRKLQRKEEINGNNLSGVFCLKSMRDSVKIDKFKTYSVVIIGLGIG